MSAKQKRFAIDLYTASVCTFREKSRGLSICRSILFLNSSLDESRRTLKTNRSVRLKFLPETGQLTCLVISLLTFGRFSISVRGGRNVTRATRIFVRNGSENGGRRNVSRARGGCQAAREEETRDTWGDKRRTERERERVL